MAKLVVVNGVPGSGKTTLVRQLRKELPGSVFLIKDDLKEFLFDALPPGDFVWSKLLGEVSIEALYAMTRVLLQGSQNVILENAFYNQLAKRDLLLFDVPVLEIYCHCDEELRKQRFINRANTTRHPGHLDREGVSLDPANYAPLEIGETIYINTDNVLEKKQIEDLTAKITYFFNGDAPSMVT